MSDLPQFPRMTFQPPKPKDPARVNQAWSRFVAKHFDLFLATYVVTLLGALKAPDIFFLMNPLMPILGTALWLPFEAVLIAATGTTPGKALVGITITDAEGRRLKLWPSVRRTMMSWIAGLGINIPIVYLVTGSLAYRRLVEDGSTSWDRDSGAEVKYVGTGLRTFGVGGAWVTVATALAVVSIVQLLKQTEKRMAEVERRLAAEIDGKTAPKRGHGKVPQTARKASRDAQ